LNSAECIRVSNVLTCLDEFRLNEYNECK
jgi:hypothetical protein